MVSQARIHRGHCVIASPNIPRKEPLAKHCQMDSQFGGFSYSLHGERESVLEIQRSSEFVAWEMDS